MESPKTKIAIPEDVINPKSYLKFVVLKNNPILVNPYYNASDGSTINIATLPHILKKKITHLSPKEQDIIMDIKSRWTRVNIKCNQAKAAAYGRIGSNGGVPREKRVMITPFENDIMELMGRMFTTQETIKILYDEYGIVATVDDVNQILRKHIVEIERRREEFRNKVADVRLFNKRPRLDELAWMYSKMKGRYISLNSMDAYNAMLRTLEQIRKEAEGDVLNLQGAINVNIEVEIQAQIQKEVFRTINIKEIILGRIAARMNYDTKKLVAGLHNSYYAKFISMSGNYDPKAEMQFPSTLSYDFDEIERNSSNAVEDVDAEDVTETEKSTATSIKEILLERIKKQKEDYDRRQAGIFIADSEKRAEQADKVGEEQPFDRALKGRGKDKYIPSKMKTPSKNFYKKED